MKTKHALLGATLMLSAQFASSQTGNTKLGTNAGVGLTTGSYHTLLGESSGKVSTVDNYNTFVGYQSGIANNGTVGANTFLGALSGQVSTTGYYNTFLGYATGLKNTTGFQNTYIGSSAGRGVNAGNNNTAVGNGAGIERNGTTTSNCNGCTFLGLYANTTIANTTLTNATAIGANAEVGANNAIVLGDANAKIGIGISIPTAKVEINNVTAGTSGLKFTQLTSASAAGASSGKVLSVDATGNVVLVPDATGSQSNYFATPVGVGVQPNTGFMLSVCGTVRAKEVTVETGWCDFVFDPNYKLRSLSTLKNYINANHHLPEIPSAQEVEKNGVPLAQMTSKLLLKVEELTLYIIKQNEKIEQLERKMNTKTKK